ncbi:MAG: iron donor protein CyaY [Myxococcales bacterium]|nr:iron donor protein CyaY [Myxococcales bacterium]
MASAPLDESEFRRLAKAAFERILDAFDAIDVDDADVEYAGDVINIRYRGGARAVVNTQGPARQLWLAGEGRGWHFSYDAVTERWLSDKGTGEEIFATLSRITRDATGKELAFS